MLSKRIVLMLTLIMALMPVVVVYAHYTDVASQFAAMQAAVAIDHANQDAQSKQQVTDHCKPHSLHSDKLHLAGCDFHVCVGCAVISSFQFISIHSPSVYSLSEKREPFSLIAPPDIRPPISRL